MNREHKILYLLANSEKPLSSYYLGEMLEVSIRTIKYDMKKVEKLAVENGALLHSKSGTGYWIEVIDKENFSEVLYQLGIRETFFRNNNEHIKLDYFRIMQYLIIQTDYFKIEEICDKFYISRNIANEVISLFRKLLATQNLRLESKPNFGLRIIGDEFSIRLAMITLFQIHFHKIEYTPIIHSFHKYFEKDQKEILDVRQIFLSTLRENDYPVIDNITQALSRYLVLQKNRNASGQRIIFDKHTIDNIKNFDADYNISFKIFSQLSKYYDYSFDQNEISAFALLLIINRDSPSNMEIDKEDFPLLEAIDKIISDYLDQLNLNDDFKQIERKYLYDDLIDYLSSPIIQHYFNFNFIGTFNHERIYNGKFESQAIYLAKQFIKVMNDNFKTNVSNNITQNIINSFSILLKKVEITRKTKPINMLIASGFGIKSAENIKKLIYKVINPDILGVIHCIELYEGRAFLSSEIDLFVLEKIDPLYYDYNWPAVTFNSDSFDNDFKELISKIYTLSK